MKRLSDRAYQLLADEVRRLAGSDPLQQPQRQLLLKQLSRLNQQEGSAVSRDEMQEMVQDFFPSFNPAVLDRASRANRPPSQTINLFQRLGCATVALGSLAGLVAFANLPYPMIRLPVAKVAPLVLLPSFISMDKHYRKTISLVEQADQLVNLSTAPADITLGKEKATAAQASLDKLPVWFLGYYPQRYCTWMSCGWRFTLDEYEQARKQIGRMEAKVFQEEQALNQLKNAEVSLSNAQALFAQVPNKAEAIASWQAALDQLEQVPEQTLAGRLAADKQVAYSRDFQAIAGNIAGENRTSLMVDVAKEYAQQAVATAINPPHSALTWQKAQGQWEDAIEHLKKVPAEDPGYREAQQLMAQYKSNLGDVVIRLEQEAASQELLDNAQRDYQNLLGYSGSADRQRSQLQSILDQVQKIQTGTTAHAAAEPLKASLSQQVQKLSKP